MRHFPIKSMCFCFERVCLILLSFGYACTVTVKFTNFATMKANTIIQWSIFNEFYFRCELEHLCSAATPAVVIPFEKRSTVRFGAEHEIWFVRPETVVIEAKCYTKLAVSPRNIILNCVSKFDFFLFSISHSRCLSILLFGTCVFMCAHSFPTRLTQFE